MAEAEPMIDTTNAMVSQFEPPPAGTLVNAINWVTEFLVGPLATSIAVITIIWIGFSMLKGHIDWRRGLSVLMGCFVIFSAQAMADGLHVSAIKIVPQPVIIDTPLTPPPIAPPSTNQTNAFDPYAGAKMMPSE